MQVGEYYRSTEPGFDWAFRIDKVYESGAVLAMYSDVGGYFTPDQTRDWIPATKAEFNADVSRSLSFQAAWRGDKS